VYPVNPKYEDVLGMKCYADLKSIPVKIDIVDIFRNANEVEPVVDELFSPEQNMCGCNLALSTNVPRHGQNRRTESHYGPLHRNRTSRLDALIFCRMLKVDLRSVSFSSLLFIPKLE